MGANKRVSRVLSLVLALALVFTMYVPVHAAVAPLLTMDVSYDAFETDATVEVTVGLNGETVSAASFTGGVAFDTAVLQLQSAVNSSEKTGIKIQVWNAEDEEWGATSLGKSTVDEANGNGHFGFYYTPTDVCEYQLDGDFIVKLTFKVLDASSSTKIYLYEDMDLGEAGAVKYDPSKDAADETEANTVELTAPTDLSTGTLGEIDDQVYTGKALKPAVKVTYDGATLKNGTDYEVAYKNNTNVGTASFTVTGKGAYYGTLEGSFNIIKAYQTLEASDFSMTMGATGDVAELSGAKAEGELSFTLKDATEGTTLSGTTLTAGEAGECTITVSAAATDNYEAAEGLDITVTIEAKEAQTLTMESSKTATVVDEPFSVAATGAKTPVTYTSSDEDVVTVDSEGMVTVVGEGTATVTATAAEDETYAEATASCEITVEKKEADELSVEDVDAPCNTTTIETELTGIPEDAEDVEVELSVASGSAIITNLKYDPETGKITGDVEGAAEGDEVEVTVTVTSSNYKEATTTFTVSFGSQAYNIVVTGGKADKETAQEGDTVTITAEVPKGQKFSKWTVASGSAVVLDDATKATTTFTMPGEDVDITAEFVKKSSSGGGSSSGSSKKFTDVPEDSYFYDPVYWAVDKGITKGTSSTKFSPFLGTTRADFVTFLYRAEGSPKVSGETPFEDLDKDAYYYDAVLWAWNNGITIGTSATTFSPSMTVTRGQAVTFLYRHAGEPAVGTVNPFTDVAESDYYYNAILWAVNKKITTGTTETTFEPNRDSYRAEVVTFLYRELK